MTTGSERRQRAAFRRRSDPFPHMSDPVPVARTIGMSPMNIVATVMNFGRSRFAAPSTIVDLAIGERPQASFSWTPCCKKGRDTAA